MIVLELNMMAMKVEVEVEMSGEDKVTVMRVGMRRVAMLTNMKVTHGMHQQTHTAASSFLTGVS